MAVGAPPTVRNRQREGLNELAFPFPASVLVMPGFALELTKLPVDGANITLIGRPNETGIQVDAVAASFGGEISNVGSDLYLAGGVRNLKIVIDPADDGLLGSLISSPIEVTAGDILLGWRAGRGVYFEGGSNLTVSVPLSFDLGPISIDEVSLMVDWGSLPRSPGR